MDLERFRPRLQIYAALEVGPALRTKLDADDLVQETFLMDVANPTWGTIIALSRLGGLRCPSEVVSLEWRHIDWQHNRITVPSPKTDCYKGKGTRELPLFKELRPFLQDAFDLAAPGETHIVGGGHLAKAQTPRGWASCNLRTSFGKMIKRAGLSSWLRLFHNLRSSRETELLEQFPVHVVARWMGHDPKVSLKHYAQTTDDLFERATVGAKSGAQVAQNQAQQAAATNGSKKKNRLKNACREALIASPCDMLHGLANQSNGAGGI